MSDSPIAKKLKIEDTETTNGEAITTNGTTDCVEKKENNSNNHQTTGAHSPEAPVVPKKEESDSTTTPPPTATPNSTAAPDTTAVPDRVATPPANNNTPPPQLPTTTAPATQPAAATPAINNRIDPNEIIAQLKESLRQEEAKLQFLRKLKLTQAKLKERQEKFAASNQTKEESKESTLPSTTALPPPPPLLKPSSIEQQSLNRICTNVSSINTKAKPFSVIVSNSQAIKPRPEPSSLATSLQSLSSITTPGIQSNNMHRTGVSLQPNRAAMAKILEEMILQQPSPKPKVLQWPICPNINDQEYLHYTGLEFIVDRLKNPHRMDMVCPSIDITCVVCGLDFSPEWEKTDFEDKFECYYCFTSKLRKQVREEHTERLKQGFIKVVQKEKEFERQLQVQQREEQLMQQKLAEQQRQQQQQIMEQQQRTLQLQLQQQTLEQLQRQQIANQLLQHLQKSRQQPGTNSALNTLLQEPTNQLLAQLQKRGQQASGALNMLQCSPTPPVHATPLHHTLEDHAHLITHHLHLLEQSSLLQYDFSRLCRGASGGASLASQHDLSLTLYKAKWWRWLLRWIRRRGKSKHTSTQCTEQQLHELLRPRQELQQRRPRTERPAPRVPPRPAPPAPHSVSN